MRRQQSNIDKALNAALVELAQPGGAPDPEQVLGPLDGAQSERYVQMVERHRLALSLVQVALDSGHELNGRAGHYLAALAADDRATRLRVLRARRAAAQALDGLDWVVIKGETIAAAMAEPHLRTFNDLDILVHPTQMADAAAALIADGFDEINQNWRAYVTHLVGEVPFSGFGATLDLHWQLVALGRTRRAIDFDIGSIIERRTTIVSHDNTVPVLAAEDQLLHVATHCALGGANRLDQLRDIAVLTGGDAKSLDWGVVANRAERYGVRRLIGHALDRSSLTLGYQLPPDSNKLTSGRHIAARRAIDAVAGNRRATVAVARDTASASGRAVGETALDSLHSRLRGAGRWDFSDPASRLYHQGTEPPEVRQNASDADKSRHRYYEMVTRQV